MKLFSENKLECILNDDVESVKKRELSTFDEIVKPFGNEIVLFGAGSLGKKLLKILRSAKIEPLAFSDNNSNLWNTAIDGVQVYSPSESARKFGNKAAFVVGIWHYGFTFLHAKKQLEKLNCCKIIPCLPLLWKYSEQLLPHYLMDLPHKILLEKDQIRKAFSIWKDDISLQIYLAFLRWQIFLDFEGLPVPTDYYPKELFNLSSEDVFVDCGAYDGDTITDFLKRRGASFRKIVAIEPDPTNYKKLENYVSTLPIDTQKKVSILHMAIGATKGKVPFLSTGTMASTVTQSGNIYVDCFPLDEIFEDILPNYIKIDVEGAELETLEGAKKLLQRSSTIWAVTCEHCYYDLWRIPLFIQSNSCEYDFFLRTHSYEGHDLVCYAIPKNRRNKI